jgi:hypothetical protein
MHRYIEEFDTVVTSIHTAELYLLVKIDMVFVNAHCAGVDPNLH